MIIKGSLPPGLAGANDEATRAILTEALRRALLHRAPRNDDELYNYFGHVHGFWLARKACCDGHRSPFDFIADAYFQRYLRLLAMASKGSGKTQALALLHVANSRFKPKCWTAHMGATQMQANRCLSPEHRLLGDDLRWKRADKYTVGDKVLGFDEHGTNRKYRLGEIESLSYADEPCFRVSLRSGQEFVTTADHLWLVGHRPWRNGYGGLYNYAWVRTDALETSGGTPGRCCSVPRRILHTWDDDLSWEAGWLAGMFDGEGWLTRSNLGIGQNPGPLLDRIASEIARFVGLPINVTREKAGAASTTAYGYKRVGVSRIQVPGGIPVRLGLLGRIRPMRIMAKLDMNTLGAMECRVAGAGLLDDVLAVVPVGVQTIIKIKTSSSTFLADGYPMHNCYDYFVKEVRRPEIIPEVDGLPIQKGTRFKNESRVEVLTATIGQASGPHEQVGTADELEQFDMDVWDHWSKTPHENHGIKAQMILASTRFSRYGPVTRIIEQLGPALAVYPFCIWDVMARCDYECKKLPAAAGPFAGKKCPLYERETTEADGSVTRTPLCAGKAHNSQGHLSWDEVVSQFLISTQGSFAVLQTLDEPGKEGLFFPECDSVRHRSAVYQYVPGRPVYLGYDDGFGFPLALGAFQVREDGLFYMFDGLYGARKLTREVCAWLSGRPWLKDVAIGWPDPSGQAAIEEFREFFQAVLGRPVMTTDADNSRVDGWNVVRRRLRGPLGGVLLGFGTDCPPEIWNDLAGLQTKPGTEDCEKKQDHGADMVRYLCRNLERYLGVQDAWTEDKRPDGQFDVERRALEHQAEATIKKHWDMLRGIGIPEDKIKATEAQFGADRTGFAKSLGGWLSQYTLRGRMQRAGLADEDDET